MGNSNFGDKKRQILLVGKVDCMICAVGHIIFHYVSFFFSEKGKKKEKKETFLFFPFHSDFGFGFGCREAVSMEE